MVLSERCESQIRRKMSPERNKELYCCVQLLCDFGLCSPHYPNALLLRAGTGLSKPWRTNTCRIARNWNGIEEFIGQGAKKNLDLREHKAGSCLKTIPLFRQTEQKT